MILLLLFAIPMVIALVVEYGFCRFPKRREWRWLPPLVTGAAAVAVAFYR